MASGNLRFSVLIYFWSVFAGCNTYVFNYVPIDTISSYILHVAVDYLNEHHQELYDSGVITNNYEFNADDIISASKADQNDELILLLRFKSKDNVSCAEHLGRMCERACDVLISQASGVRVLTRSPKCREQVVAGDKPHPIQEETSICNFIDSLIDQVQEKQKHFCPLGCQHGCPAICGSFEELLKYFLNLKLQEFCHHKFL